MTNKTAFAPSPSQRFRITPADVKKGAQFYVPKTTSMIVEGGNPVTIRGGATVEATGNSKRDVAIEVVYKGKTGFVHISDITRSLQSAKSAAGFPVFTKPITADEIASNTNMTFNFGARGVITVNWSDVNGTWTAHIDSQPGERPEVFHEDDIDVFAGWLRDVFRTGKGRSAGARTASAQDTYEKSSDLNAVLKALVANEDKNELKITAKFRQALTAMAQAALAPISHLVGGSEGEDLTPAEVLADITTGGQKSVFSHVADLIRDRKNHANLLVDPRTRKPTAHGIDYLLTAAVIQAALVRGKTQARAEWLVKNLPAVAYKAGGSSYQAALITALRGALKWSDIEKGRKSKTASADDVEVPAIDDQALITMYSPFPAPVMGFRYQDTVFAALRSKTPYLHWTRDMCDPFDMLAVLTASPRTITASPAIEANIQLQSLVAELTDDLFVNHKLDSVVDPGANGYSLADLVTIAVMEKKIARYIDQSLTSWHKSLRDKTGNPIVAMNAKAVPAFTAALLLQVAATEEATDAVRAASLYEAMLYMKQNNLMAATTVAAKIKRHFPWPSVASMLRFRLGLPKAALIVEITPKG